MPDYSLGVVTYLGRYERFFQPFVRQVAAHFPGRELIVFINGHHDILQQAAYLRRVTAFLAGFPQVRAVTHLEHQSLARGWNHLVWLASAPRILICNDDLTIGPGFRADLERALAEQPGTFVINRSWSHFVMPKSVLAEVGWFDERFRGVGYEDGDYMVRLVAAGKPLVSVDCRDLTNHVAPQPNAGWARESGVTRGKYSRMNEEFFQQKYESNFTGVEERADDGYAHRFPWNGEVLKATLRPGMEAPDFYPRSLLAAPPEALETAPAAGTVRPPRLVGLMAVRNEAHRLPVALRALARFTDAIVLLDDCSGDASVAVARALAAECRIERVLTKDQWLREESLDRNRLLDAGREIGGTHFFVLDADEVITGNLLGGDFLRRHVAGMAPGDRLQLNWIHLWRGLDQYRDDQSVWSHNYKDVIFADDGASRYEASFLHTWRVPRTLAGQVQRLSGYEGGLLHFQFVNWENLLMKQAWYRCLERVRCPDRPAAEINARYAPSKDESGLVVKPAPAAWFTGYAGLDFAQLALPDVWRHEQVQQWFAQHGPEYFRDLDIWDVPALAAARTAARPVAATAPARPPRVTAIVSVYQAERFLGACLRDLVDQTLHARGELEIIVVNTGSPQGERAIVERWQRDHPSIRYLETPDRRTLSAAWNLGARAARGSCLTNANADDRHAPDALEVLAAALEADPALDLVYSDCIPTTSESATFATAAATGRRYRYPDYFAPDALLHYQFGIHPMWRRTLHEEIGWFDENLAAAGDYDFNLRFALAGRRARRLDRVLGVYFAGAGTITYGSSRIQEETAQLLSRYRSLENILRLYAHEGAPTRPALAAACILGDFGLRALGQQPPWLEGRRVSAPELTRAVWQAADGIDAKWRCHVGHLPSSGRIETLDQEDRRLVEGLCPEERELAGVK